MKRGRAEEGEDGVAGGGKSGGAGAAVANTANPFNADGYRYSRAELDPHAARVLPEGAPKVYRIARDDAVACSGIDRAPQLKLSGRVVTGEKGYSMLRATHGVRAGRWYYEVKVLPGEKGFPALPNSHTGHPHCRIGWSTR